MLYLTKKEREAAEEKYEYAACLKEFVKTQDENEIRLWDTTEGQILGSYLATNLNERGFIIEVIMNGCGQFINLADKNLVEACQAFNTILQTIRA